MVKKTCPYCGKDSYSATGAQKWLCPYCEKDITHVEAVATDDKIKREPETNR